MVRYSLQNSWGSARAVCYSNVTGHYVLATSSSKVCFYEEGSGIAWKIFDSPSTSVGTRLIHRFPEASVSALRGFIRTGDIAFQDEGNFDSEREDRLRRAQAASKNLSRCLPTFLLPTGCGMENDITRLKGLMPVSTRKGGSCGYSQQRSCHPLHSSPRSAQSYKKIN